MSLEKICLNWNKFEENILTSFRSLREDIDFSDVSLVCADGLNQDNIEAFLRFSKELELKGLEEDSNLSSYNLPKFSDKLASSLKKEPNATTETNIKLTIQDISNYPEEVLVSEMTVVVPNQTPAVNFKEMDEKIKAMMSRGQTMRKDGKHKNTLCIICGKEGQYINIRDHIEARHMDSISLPCNFCERTFRTRCTLRKHMVGHKDKTMNYIRLFKDFEFNTSNEISKPVQDWCNEEKQLF